MKDETSGALPPLGSRFGTFFTPDGQGHGFNAIEFIQIEDPQMVKKQKLALLDQMKTGL